MRLKRSDLSEYVTTTFCDSGARLIYDQLMLSVIWSGAADASDVFYLIAAILAGIAALLYLVGDRVVSALPMGLTAAALCLLALGLLAL